MTKPAKPQRPWSPMRGLTRVLWQQPIAAIPFALFFGTMFGSGWNSYIAAYKASLVFAYVIGLAIWGVRVWMERSPAAQKLPLWAEVMCFVVAAMTASFLASLILHFTFLPGMLGSARAVAMTGMYAVLFVILVTGLAYAYRFYHESLARARSEQELHMARRIQRGFLLSEFPTMPRLEVHALNISSRQVSGDFYDVVPAGDGAFLLAIADVSGKGVPAALLSSMLQASLRTQAPTVSSVGEILRNVNRLVHSSASPGQFATFFLARVDEKQMKLAFSNAGHNYPVLLRRDGSMKTLERGGTVVGVLPDVPFEEDAVDLAPGDRVVFYTDGISEAANAKGALYGDEEVARAAAALPANLSARETIDRLLDGVRGHLDGVEAGDDMTLMVLRVLD